jgi:hypothetical protein
MSISQTGRTITPDSGWSQIVEIDETNNTYQALNSVQQTFAATGTNNPSWTISSSSTGPSAAIAIKGLVSPPMIPLQNPYILMR